MLKPYSKAEIAFDLHTNIGHEGKNSEAYIAHDSQLDAQIVVKKVAKSKIESIDEYFSESRTLYLSAHPNVVQIHYACQDSDCIYIAMPYYAKGSLKSLMAQRHLTVREIIVFGCQVASGLHNVHSKGLIHFDVKPDNILLSDRGEAVLSDFGLARPFDRNGHAEPTALYGKMPPPEAYKSPSYTTAFDIYQFGCTLYRMCNGDANYNSQFDKYRVGGNFDRDAFKFDVMNERFPDRKVFPEHIPSRLKKVIQKCMKADPTLRPATIIEVANELGRVESCLDWQFIPNQDSREWALTTDEYHIRFEQSVDGSTKAYKSKNGGKAMRIVAGCTPNMKYTEVAKFLDEHHVAKD